MENHDFINELERFYLNECNLEKKQIDDIRRTPLKNRVEMGEAIDNIEVVNVYNKIAELSCKENISKFRIGDILIFHRGNLYEGYHCILTEDLDTNLKITANFRSSFSNLNASSGWILDRDYVGKGKNISGILNSFRHHPDLLSEIKTILFGGIKAQYNDKKYQKALKIGDKYGLDASQREAFARAYAADKFHVIQGPPGTGKTWVLAYLAAELAKEGENVFITAFTHRAINNALNKIVRFTGYGNTVKIGKKQNADDLALVNNYESFRSINISQKGFIIGATCYELIKLKKRGENLFDTVIIDEAAQMPIPLSLCALTSAKRFVLIGDHKQMNPILLDDYHDQWYARSIFETVFTHTPGTMLETTYRMNQEICRFPSKRFYENRLFPSKDIVKNRLELRFKPNNYSEILNPDIPDIFVEVNHKNCSIRSQEEADIAAGVAAEALKCGVSPDEIGILAIYRAQVRLIRNKLIELASSFQDELNKVVVDTVERMQGQERDIIIVSLTLSDLSLARHGVDFFLKPNRLNVCLTRAKVKRIVIGNPGMFKTKPQDQRIREWLEHFHAFYAESNKINADIYLSQYKTCLIRNQNLTPQSNYP